VILGAVPVGVVYEPECVRWTSVVEEYTRTFVELFVFRSKLPPERLELAMIEPLTPQRKTAWFGEVTVRFEITTLLVFQISTPPRYPFRAWLFDMVPPIT
jgi:hypothetical protein